MPNQLNSLSQKQHRFVAEYLVDGNGTRAAIAAGYRPVGARVQASRMLRLPNVREALEARQHADAERLSIEREDAIQGFRQAIDQAKAMGNPAAMIAGWRALAELLGLYPPKVHRVDVNQAGKPMHNPYEAMSDAEWMAVIDEEVEQGPVSNVLS